MLYNDLNPPIFFATGEARGIKAIFDRVVKLPQISLSIREEHLPIVAKHYRVEPVPMLKMALLPVDFRSVTAAIGVTLSVAKSLEPRSEILRRSAAQHALTRCRTS
jgi:hypothetical protein